MNPHCARSPTPKSLQPIYLSSYQMFVKYAGMKMEERDPLVAEWANTIRVEEVPTASAPKS